MIGQQQRDTKRTSKTDRAAEPGAAAGRAIQMKKSLAGKPYDEQVAMLSPAGAAAPVQMDGATGGAKTEAPTPAPVAEKKDGEAPAGEAPTAPAPDANTAAEPPAVTPYAYGAAELKTLVDDKLEDASAEGRADLGKRWVKYGVECSRAAASAQVKAGVFTAFETEAQLEGAIAATFPDFGQAGLDAAEVRSDWLVKAIGAYLAGAPVAQAALRADKGPAQGADDKSATVTADFIKQLEALEAAVKGAFPDSSAAAVKELTVRRELFKMFAEHHDKNNTQSGIGTNQSNVKAKVESKVTSCNAYQSKLLGEAFGKADAGSKQAGGEGVSIKATKQYGWDMKAKKTTIGAPKKAFGFFDNLGRAAKEAGAWTAGAAGLTPKAGDMYVLAKGGSISHIGFFKFSEPTNDPKFDVWHTFDGGQPAGQPMSGEIAGAVKTVRDGALNNVKRVYAKADNTAVIPDPARLATLRGETEEPSSDEKQPKKKVQINQDGELRTVAGIIDIGKLIEADKAAAAKP